jgi:hypothetical protein
MSSADKDRAERLFRQRQEAPKALEEYRDKQEATRNLTAKLRAERLAREASSKPKHVQAASSSRSRIRGKDA